MSSQVANFATGLGNYDAKLVGNNTVVALDASAAVGMTDLSMNGGYLVNTTAWSMPASRPGACWTSASSRAT